MVKKYFKIAVLPFMFVALTISIILSIGFLLSGRALTSDKKTSLICVDRSEDRECNLTEKITGMEFVWIPKGCFNMGQTEKEKEYLIKKVGKKDYEEWLNYEQPRHKVCLDGFYMGKYEVTRGQFKQFVRETGYKTDAEKKGRAKVIFEKNGIWTGGEKQGYNYKNPGFSQTDKHPVVCVSWNDAKAYIKWLNKKTNQKFSLPTEAQWEYAARAKTNTMRFWGQDESDACKYANIADRGSNWPPAFLLFLCSDSYQYTSPVGKFKENPFGLYDILGNVWEWCEDVYAGNAYKKQKHGVKNPLVTFDSSPRVLRGGSWFNSPILVRTGTRNWDFADYCDSFNGFRLCLFSG